MRRIVLALALTATAIVLLFSYHTSRGPEALAATTSETRTVAPATTGSSGESSGSSSGDGSASGSGSSATATPQATTTKKATSTAKRTIKGDAIQSQWGTTQVAAGLEGSKLVDVQVIQQTDIGGRSSEIDAYALPQLRQEAIAAGSANIDSVSGATITSDGYTQSLQSALDKA